MKRLGLLLKVFALWTLWGMLSKCAFLALYHGMIPDLSLSDCVQVLWHGLRLDVAIAAYLTLLPTLLCLVSLYYRGKVLRYTWNGYFALTSLVSVLGYVSNLGLYAYWGFPLDNTPLLYLRTSPADAMASLTLWQMILLPLLLCALTWALYALWQRVAKPLYEAYSPTKRMHRVLLHVALLLLLPLWIIPIRGGFGTGTNHTGSVYFSTRVRLNHAAVNPLFCFVESVSHQEEIGTKYRFMADDEATRLFSRLTHTRLRQDTPLMSSPSVATTPQDSPTLVPSSDRVTNAPTQVVLICLESFSQYIMQEKGHVQDVVPQLERLSREGVYFSRFYANSFRTDRALVSVLSGIPAQPTMSLMDMPRKSTSLPSLARSLGEKGYSTHFYYGGDTNYSNMRSYLMGTGFQQIVSDTDFPSHLHTGKWGVADGPVYDRLLEDIRQTADQPTLRVMMTASSHEPFDVPYKGTLSSPELNAFAYADACLGRFVEALKALPSWRHTLLVIVPDHLGCYPKEIDNYALWRYEIPLILMGGCIEPSGRYAATLQAPRRIDTLGSQVDIAATLLALLGYEHEEFIYSKDLLDAEAPHFAFFTFPDAMGLLTDTCRVLYDNTAGSLVLREGTHVSQHERMVKAYLQKLYDDLDKR